MPIDPAELRTLEGDQLDPTVDLADFANATRAEPLAAWRSLALVRNHDFTGEVVFETEPEVRAYLDRGTVYLAERAGRPSIGQRLVDRGVIEASQLQGGTVRIGDVEHLGRLFDRDPDVDRDAVLVAVESDSERVLADIADERVPVRITPYRHHPAGVHRWFVAPVQIAPARPISEVAQVDRSVVEELPALGTAARHVRIEWNEPGPFAVAAPLPPPPAAPPAPPTAWDADVARDVEAALDVDADPARDIEADHGGRQFAEPAVEQTHGAGLLVAGTATDAATATDAVAGEVWDGIVGTASTVAAPTPDALEPRDSLDTAPDADDTGVEDFHVVWPDGSAEPALPLPPVTVAPWPEPPAESSAESPAGPADTARAESASSDGSAPSASLPAGGPGSTLAGGWFDLSGAFDRPAEAAESADQRVAPDDVGGAPLPPPTRVDALPAPDADVPTDVADAVRRALMAIETASASPSLRSTIPPLDAREVESMVAPDATVAAPADRGADTQPDLAADQGVVADAPALDAAARPAFAPPLAPSFAPPTPDMAVEAIYARSAPDETPPPDTAGEGSSVDDRMESIASSPSAHDPRPPVVFLEPADEPAGDERAGALRRLIKSLRRNG